MAHRENSRLICFIRFKHQGIVCGCIDLLSITRTKIKKCLEPHQLSVENTDGTNILNLAQRIQEYAVDRPDSFGCLDLTGVCNWSPWWILSSKAIDRAHKASIDNNGDFGRFDQILRWQ